MKYSMQHDLKKWLEHDELLFNFNGNPEGGTNYLDVTAQTFMAFSPNVKKPYVQSVKSTHPYVHFFGK